MPKNQFQRPTPVTHSHQVPRHKGAPLPSAKPSGRIASAPPSSAGPLPSLSQLLRQQGRTR